MILDRSDVTAQEFHDATGWAIEPDGLCRVDRCVPLGGVEPDAAGRYDLVALADRLAMPVAHDTTHRLWAVGPEAGGRVLDSALMPELALPDLSGNVFDVASLRGRKVLLLAWASW